MFLFLVSRIISSTAAFLYPGYATYKTLSRRPASEEELEQWLMYWSVLGCLVGVEYIAEWLVSWLPFYYTMKTLFLLYLALPQTRGSSYLYKAHLQPFFHTYEHDIDATLASLKVRVYTFMQEKVRMLWEHIVATLGQSGGVGGSSAGGQSGVNPGGGVGSAQPPTMNDPAAGPAQIIGSLWRTYGPSIIAGGAALINQLPARSQAAASTSFFELAAQTQDDARLSPQGEQGSSQQSLLERRRRLEAELAILSQVSNIPTPNSASSASIAATSGARISPTNSDTDLRVRAQYEEVEIPSDVEGYDVEPTKNKSSADTADNEQGHAYSPPGVERRASWFGWPFASANSGDKSGYEKLKGE